MMIEDVIVFHNVLDSTHLLLATVQGVLDSTELMQRRRDQRLVRDYSWRPIPRRFHTYQVPP